MTTSRKATTSTILTQDAASISRSHGAPSGSTPELKLKSTAGRTVIDGATALSREGRSGMIAQAAYFRAERRGFAPGQELEDWVAAEQEVDRLLSAPTAALTNAGRRRIRRSP